MSEVSNRNVTSLSEQAAEWVIRLSEGQISHEQHADFESWLAQDIRHREAYEQAIRLWQSIAPQKRKSGNRIKIFTGVLLLLGSLYWLSLSEWLADERTSVGEIRQIVLPDGSSITLDSRSAVDIDFNAHYRRIILHRGRLLAEVVQDGTDNERPFVVKNRDGVAEALGTRYVVEQTEHDSVVNVIESHVAVTSRYQLDQSIVLHNGQSIRFDSRRIYQLEALPPYVTSWAQARLVYQDASLSQVISDLARYRKGFINMSEEAGQLRFTGVLSADDPDAALHILENALPIKIRQSASWLIWISLQT